MDPQNLTPEGVERLRRSVTMLTPRHPGALDREAALALLDELERMQARCGRLEHGVADAVRDLQTRVERLLR